MHDLLSGQWMTGELPPDSGPEVILAALDARTALRGWPDAKVLRVDRYLRRVAMLSWSYEGARMLERRLQLERREPYLSRLTARERVAVAVLRSISRGDVESTKENHTRLLRAHLEDARIGASHRQRAKKMLPKFGLAKRQEKASAKQIMWEEIAAKIRKVAPGMKGRSLAARVAAKLGIPRETESIRRYLAKMKSG